MRTELVNEADLLCWNGKYAVDKSSEHLVGELAGLREYLTIGSNSRGLGNELAYIFLGHIGILVGIDRIEAGLSGIARSHFMESGGVVAAGTTPGGIEIDDGYLAGLGSEIVVGKFDNSIGSGILRCSLDFGGLRGGSSFGRIAGAA